MKSTKEILEKKNFLKRSGQDDAIDILIFLVMILTFITIAIFL